MGFVGIFWKNNIQKALLEKKREFRDKLSLRYFPCFALIKFPNIAAVQQIKKWSELQID